MKKRQILWAIVFGSMLAITGCGDDPVENGGEAGSGGSAGSGGTTGTGGSAGSGGSGGSGSGDFCSGLCQACGDSGAAECTQSCEMFEGQIPGELDKCPPEFNALLACYEANGCTGDGCNTEAAAWATCIFLP